MLKIELVIVFTGQTREVDLKLEMGQTAEKLYSADEKCKTIEKERDDLKRRYLLSFTNFIFKIILYMDLKKPF